MHTTPMTPSRSRAGVAMIAALGFLTVAAAIMTLLFVRSLDEIRHGRDDAAIVQTLLVAQGGANLGIALLHRDVQTDLDEIVSHRAAGHASAWSFGDSQGNDEAPTPDSVARALDPVLAELQQEIDGLTCDAPDLGGGVAFTLRIHVAATACGEALPSGVRLGDPRFVSGTPRAEGGNQRYAVPFVMIAEGIQGDHRRRVVTNGEYRFVVGRRSFARYALFTDVHSTADGNAIWFTGDTLFDGPVHTNDNFRFFDDPWFGGAVSSAGDTWRGQGAWGYPGNSSHFFGAADLEFGGNTPKLDTGSYYNRTYNRPQFDDGVDWRAEYIALPDNAYDQKALAQADGIHFSGSLRYLELYAADRNGDPISNGEESDYQYIVGRGTGGYGGSTVTYRLDDRGRLERCDDDPDDCGTGDWSLVTTAFNGVVYAEGYIERLRGAGREDGNDPDSARPAIASFAQITVVPNAGARITSDLTYETPPCTGSLHRNDDDDIVRADCSQLDADNVLGIFAPQGDIRIGNYRSDESLNAPEDVRIHGVLMTSDGVVTVENHNQGSRRGEVELLGGIIEESYGAFGTFGGSRETGYGRRFTYDRRMASGFAPPYFPTVGIDGVTDVQTFTYGRREQIY